MTTPRSRAEGTTPTVDAKTCTTWVASLSTLCRESSHSTCVLLAFRCSRLTLIIHAATLWTQHENWSAAWWTALNGDDTEISLRVLESMLSRTGLDMSDVWSAMHYLFYPFYSKLLSCCFRCIACHSVCSSWFVFTQIYSHVPKTSRTTEYLYEDWIDLHVLGFSSSACFPCAFKTLFLCVLRERIHNKHILCATCAEFTVCDRFHSGILWYFIFFAF